MYSRGAKATEENKMETLQQPFFFFAFLPRRSQEAAINTIASAPRVPRITQPDPQPGKFQNSGLGCSAATAGVTLPAFADAACLKPS